MRWSEGVECSQAHLSMRPCAFLSLAPNFAMPRESFAHKNHEQRGKNEIQELHAKEVGVSNPSEERASS